MSPFRKTLKGRYIRKIMLAKITFQKTMPYTTKQTNLSDILHSFPVLNIVDYMYKIPPK